MSQDQSTAAAPRVSEGPDHLDRLAGDEHNERLRTLRAQRPDAARHIEGSYRALFEPDDPAGVSRLERELAALRVAVLTSQQALGEHHRARLRDEGAGDETLAAVVNFPHGPALPPRQAALLEFADLLTSRPRDASRESVASLSAAGFDARDIVTIAQLVAFVNFEVRLLSGLRLLGEQQ